MNIELTIQKLVYGGDGMGTVGGKVYFVEGALPGEKILARVVSEKKNFGKAKLVTILDDSPARIPPPCPYVRECGGCQYQHLTYEEELKWKTCQVREAFSKTLGLNPDIVSPIRPGPEFFGYRNSVTLHKTPARCGMPGRLGFVGRDNRSVIAVDRCLLAGERLQSVFGSAHRLSPGEKDRTFRCDETGRIVSSETDGVFSVRVGDVSLTAAARGFFQNNLAVTETIARQVAGWVREISPRCFVDLFAGVGTFSILAATGIREIFCFEENPASVACLEENFKRHGLPLKAAVRGRVERTFPDFLNAGQASQPLLVFLDPPRQGLEPSLAKCLAGCAADHILYLSCDPATLVRDLKIILSAGRREITGVIPFDMFPRTRHIETLVRLVQTAGK